MPALEIEYPHNTVMMPAEPLSHTQSPGRSSGGPLWRLLDLFAEALHQCALSRKEDRKSIARPGVWLAVPCNQILPEARRPSGARRSTRVSDRTLPGIEH